MSIIRINRNPSRKELQVFGVCWLGFFGILGAVLFWRTAFSAIVVALWIFAVVIPLAGWFLPSFMKAVFVCMSYATYPIGMTVSFLILAFVFYLVITPIGIIIKILGYDPLKRKFDPNVKSFWIEKEAKKSLDSYFRQF